MTAAMAEDHFITRPLTRHPDEVGTGCWACGGTGPECYECDRRIRDVATLQSAVGYNDWGAVITTWAPAPAKSRWSRLLSFRHETDTPGPAGGHRRTRSWVPR